MATITFGAVNGNWSDATKWVGGVRPTAADDVLLTAASANVTVDSATLCVCRSLDCSAYIGVLTFGAGANLAVGDASGGAFKLVAGMTVTLSGGTISAVTTSTNAGVGWSWTSAGKTLPALTVNAPAGKIILADALNIGTATLTVTAGGFFGNGQTITCGSFTGTGTATRTVDLTNCTVSCTGWTFTTTTNLTFVSTGSAITQNGAITFNGGALTYNNVTVVASGVSISGNNTFANLTITGQANKTSAQALNNSQVVTGTLTLGGNTTQGVNRLLVSSNANGTQRTFTLTGGAVVINGDVDFADINITGSPSWTNTGSKFVGDGGGNGTLIVTNRTTPAAQTYNGTASDNWSTLARWTSRVPLPQDNVTVVAITAGTLTLDMPRLGANVDFTGTTRTVDMGLAVELYGNLTLAAGMTFSGTQAVTFAGRGAQTITSNGRTFTQALVVDCGAGTYTLADTLACSRGSATAVQVVSGTLVDNGQSVNLTGVTSGYRQTGGTLTATGTWTISDTATGNIWNVTAGTVNGTGSTIILSAASANTRTFAGFGQTYGTLTYTVAGSTGILAITGNNTWSGNWNLSDATNARNVQIAASSTQTFTGAAPIPSGTSGKLVTFVSSTPGTFYTFTKTSGIVIGNYLSLTDSHATGGAAWYAGTNSTNVSGNTGWVFTDAVVVGTQTSSTSTRFGGALAAAISGAQTSETDIGAAGTPRAAVSGAQSAESDSGVSGGVLSALVGGQASELDTVVGGTPAATAAGTQAAESDTLAGGTPTSSLAGSQVGEIDSATAGTLKAAVTGGQGTETDTANGGSARPAIAGTRASETDIASPGTSAVAVPGVASESDTPISGLTRIVLPGGQVIVVEIVLAGVLAVRAAGILAAEQDSGFSGVGIGGLIPPAATFSVGVEGVTFEVVASDTDFSLEADGVTFEVEADA